MEGFLRLVEGAREELAKELCRRQHEALADRQGFGRFVDRVVIWSLFDRMCQQRNVEPPRLADWEDASDGFCSEFMGALLNKYEPDFAEPLPAETLGSVYESFLGRTLTLGRNGLRFEAARLHRKSGGAFYTPQYVVDYIVDETVGKLIAGKSPEEMREVRVLDPACGAGRFLLRVYDRMVQEHVRWFRAHGDKERLTCAIKGRIVENCIFGVDIDGLAVEVARLSLYVKLIEDESSQTARLTGVYESCVVAPRLRSFAQVPPALKRGARVGTPASRAESETSRITTSQNIRCGNSLLAAQGDGFDVVIGNPPYGAKLTETMRARLAKEFDAGTTETAALMMLQAARKLTRRGGVNGFIVPKAFTYSSNWAKVRDELLGEMTALVDAGKVWPEVKLEQVIYFLHKGEAENSYANRKRRDERFEDVACIDKEHCRQFGFLLNGITKEELGVGLKIQRAGSFLSEYVTNTRGAMFQEQVAKGGRGRRVIGGKQIQRYGIEGAKGFVSSKVALDKNSFVAPGSILVQNILAHIENPVDHIKITAAVVEENLAKEIVILDTVNQLTNRSGISSNFFLAILNSRLMNWYVYRFICAKAIRTMHFDGPVTGRIPVPRITAENKRVYEEIVASGGSQAEAAVYGLYGLSAEEVGVVESGMAAFQGEFQSSLRDSRIGGRSVSQR